MSPILVDRDLLERITAPERGMERTKAVHELEGLLLAQPEQPAGEVPTIGHSDYVSQLETRIAELEAELEAANELLVRQAKANIELRAELAGMREQEPVRLTPEVREFLKEAVQDTYMGDSFSSTDSDFVACVEKLLLPIYAAPAAKPRVVMPEHMDKQSAPTLEQILFILGWNECLDEFTRLNAADQEGDV
jgi:hypothetical protein